MAAVPWTPMVKPLWTAIEVRSTQHSRRIVECAVAPLGLVKAYGSVTRGSRPGLHAGAPAGGASTRSSTARSMLFGEVFLSTPSCLAVPFPGNYWGRRFHMGQLDHVSRDAMARFFRSETEEQERRRIVRHLVAGCDRCLE